MDDRKATGTTYKRIGYALLVGGLVLICIKAAMNWWMGDLLGATTAGKWLTSIGSVSIDIVGLMVMGTAAGVAIATRTWGWAFLFVLALVGSAGWSGNSILSFQATERMSASSARAALIAHDAKAAKLAEDSSKWWASVAAKQKRADSRKDFIAASRGEVQAYRDSKFEARIEPDAGAMVWATITGRSMMEVQIGQATYFAILIIFLSTVAFPGSGWFLAQGRALHAASRREAELARPGLATQPSLATPGQANLAANDDHDDDDDQASPGHVGNSQSGRNRQRKVAPHLHVEAMLRTLRAMGMGGQKVTHASILQMYGPIVTAIGYRPLHPSTFFEAFRNAGIKRDRERLKHDGGSERHTTYMIPETDAELRPIEASVPQSTPADAGHRLNPRRFEKLAGTVISARRRLGTMFGGEREQLAQAA